MFCAIWYHLYYLKNVKNTHGGVLLLVKLKAKLNTPSWAFFKFFLVKQMVPNQATHHIFACIKFQRSFTSEVKSYA